MPGGDIALKRLQLGLEGNFATAGVYNGGSAVAATRRFAVDKSVSADWQPTFENPVEARGSYAGSYVHILHMIQAVGKIAAAVYPDDLCYIMRMCVSGTPTVTALQPTAPAVLAATALTATTTQSVSATTQPNAMADCVGTNVGKILAITLSNASSNTQQITVTVVGTDIFGNALTEAVVFTTGTTTPSKVSGTNTVTLYTKSYFKTINASGITFSSATTMPTTDQVALAAVNGFLWLFQPDMGVNTLNSGTFEYMDGVASWQLPGSIVDKATIQASIGKSLQLSGSFQSKQKVALAAAAGSINPAASLGDPAALTNIADTVIQAIPTYQTTFFADDMGTAPGTTAISARLSDFKFDIDNGIKLSKTADGTPYPTFISRDYYGDKVTAAITLLFNSYGGGTTDPADIAKFLAFTSRTVRSAFPGPALQCGGLSVAGSWPTWAQQSGKGGYYGFAVDLAGKWTQVTETAIDTKAAFAFTLNSEVDIQNMGVPYQITVISRINPNM